MTSFIDTSDKTKFPLLNKYAHNVTAELREKDDIQPIIGRDREIRRVAEILTQKYKNNVMLVGPPGVGKTALCEGVSQMINQEGEDGILAGKEIWEINLAGLTSADTSDGGFKVRFQQLLKEIENSEGHVVPFIDEAHILMGAKSSGDAGSLDAANILKPALARGKLHMIAATTLWEYHRDLEKDGAIARRFQTVTLAEPTPEQTVEILRARKRSLEIFHKVTITEEALQAAVDYSVRYITNRYLPDKAIDVLDQAGAATRLAIDNMPPEMDSLKNKIAKKKIALKNETSKYKKKILQDELNSLEPELNAKINSWQKDKLIINKFQETRKQLEGLRTAKIKSTDANYIAEIDDKIEHGEQQLALFKKKFRESNPIINEEVDEKSIMNVINSITGVPMSELSKSLRERLLHLEDTLHKRVIGQDKAVRDTAYAIKRSRLGLGDTSKPIATFLFLGPTGVGKTELVKTLAETMFGNEDAMVRFDMGEFQDRKSISRLIGADPGTPDADDGGQLTEFVKHNPYSIVLFDEAEKAHPGIWDLMLSIFDDGEIKDNRGDDINFRNTIIIMTSNIGSNQILRGVDKKTGELTKKTINDVNALLRNNNPDASGRRGFRPEFINRLDAVEMFLPLTREQDEKIARLKLRSLNKRVFASRKLHLVYSAPKKEYMKENQPARLTVSYWLANQLSATELQFGGRPIQRYIRSKIEDSLTDYLLTNDVQDGGFIYIEVAYPKGPKTIKCDDGHTRVVQPIIKLQEVDEDSYNALLESDPIEHPELNAD